MRRRRFAGLAILAIALAGCASSHRADPASSPTAAAPSDPRLVGGWQVAAAQVRGHPVIRADETTQSGFEFTRDGTVVVSDQTDTTVGYRTGHGFLSLIYPDGEYDGTVGGTKATLRIATVMEHVEDAPRLRYVANDPILVLSTPRYRLTLRRGDPHRPTFTPKPSASPTTGPPSARRSGR